MGETPLSELLKSLGDYYEDDTLPGERRSEPRSLVEQVGQHVALVFGALPRILCSGKLGCARAASLLFEESNREAKKISWYSYFSP